MHGAKVKITIEILVEYEFLNRFVQGGGGRSFLLLQNNS